MRNNVSDGERVASILIGGAALANAALRPSALRTAVCGSIGLGFLWRGLSGNCPVYRKIGIDVPGASPTFSGPFRLEKSILINKPLSEVVDFFRASSFADLSFIQGRDPYEFHSKSAARRWTLRLSEAGNGKTTRLSATAKSRAQDSNVRKMLCKVNRAALSHAVAAELRNIKALIETGVIATIGGQSHGQRGVVGKLAGGFMNTVHKQLERVAELPIQPSPVARQPLATHRVEGRA